MKKSFFAGLVFAFLAVSFSLAAAPGKWTDNFEEAQKEAKTRGVPIFALFTGSDWCSWCMKLDKEVLSQSAFKNYAKKSLVLLKLDYPRQHKVSKKIKKQNEELSDKYGIQGFPSVLLLDPEGKVVAKTSYRPGGAKEYVNSLKDLLKDYAPPADAKDNVKPGAKPVDQKSDK